MKEKCVLFKNWEICIIFLLEGFLISWVQGSFFCPGMEVLDSGELNCKEITEILNVHNEIRESIARGLVNNQPRASNMQEMYWDEELANDAQNWANKCIFDHNSKKEREVARFEVGQNIAQTKTKKSSSEVKEFRKQIYKWFEEYKNFKFGPIKNNGMLQNTGHYTQIAWASTYLVGCGYSRFKNKKGRIYKLYVCHYGPSGNEEAKTPYKTGGIKCPKKLVPSKKYPNLCSLKKPPSINVCKEKKWDKQNWKKISKLPVSRRFFEPETFASTEFDVENNKSQESKEKLGNNLSDPKINLYLIYVNKFLKSK